MIKKFVGILAVLAAAACMGGCGSSGGEGKTLNQMKVEKYVKLGDYSSFEVTVDVAGVDGEELKGIMSDVYAYNVTPEHGGITDRPVEVGDTVFIDYEGKKDDVPFAGGTAKNAALGIGSGEFIPGFEDGLVGVMPGETVDLDLTFPESYGNPELAGKAVVFTVTVNYIQPVWVEESDMEDVVVASIGIEGVYTVAELRQYVYDYLYSEYESDVRSGIVEILLDRSEFDELPEEMMENYCQMWSGVFTAYADSYQVTLEQYANYFYQTTGDKLVKHYAEMYLMQDLMLQAIANKEGLKIGDEELKDMIREEAEAAGAATMEEYMGDSSLEDYRNDYMRERVLDYLMERTAIREAE